MAEEEDQFFQVGNAQFIVEPIQRMGDRMGDPRFGEHPLQIVNVLTGRLEFAMLGFGDTPGEDLHPAVVFREIGGDLFAEDYARLLCNRQATLDAVVIRERDKLHPRCPQPRIKRERIGVAVREIQPPEQPFRRPVAVAGMEMEIGFGKHALLGRLPHIPPTCPASRFIYTWTKYWPPWTRSLGSYVTIQYGPLSAEVSDFGLESK